MSETATMVRNQPVSLETIQEVVDQISAKFHPQKIILFGSYARGNPTPDSDVDLLVVMPLNDKTPIRQSIEILQAIEYRFAIDLIVRTPEELKRRIALGDYFLMDAVEEGQVLYESNHSRVDHKG